MRTMTGLATAADVVRTRLLAPTHLGTTGEVRRLPGGAGTYTPPGPQLQV